MENQFSAVNKPEQTTLISELGNITVDKTVEERDRPIVQIVVDYYFNDMVPGHDRILMRFIAKYPEGHGPGAPAAFNSEQVVPSYFLRARTIVLMPMIEQGEKDDKIIAVYAIDPEYHHFNISELPQHRLEEICCLFGDYKNENKEVAVSGFLPADDAINAIKYYIEINNFSKCVSDLIGLDMFIGAVLKTLEVRRSDSPRSADG